MTFKQVFLINNDLGMRAGKVAVQVAHGETLYMEDIMLAYCNEEPSVLYSNFVKWRQEDIKPIGLMKKVVLKATQKEIADILIQLAAKKIRSWTVFDIGLTQVPENSLTCVCTEPLPEEQCNTLFGHLKLL